MAGGRRERWSWRSHSIDLREVLERCVVVVPFPFAVADLAQCLHYNKNALAVSMYERCYLRGGFPGGCSVVVIDIIRST
jgi:hypothetical protein